MLLAALTILATIVPPAGRPVAPPSYGVMLPTPTNVHTAASGDTFLTVWRMSGTAVRGSLADANGETRTPVSFPIIQDGDADWIDLAGTPGGYTLFWGDDTTIRMAKLDEEANVLSQRTLAIPGDFRAHAVWSGERFLLAGRNFFDASRPHEAYLLDFEGNVLRGPITLGYTTGNMRVTTSGRDFVVSTFDPAGLTVLRVSADGDVVSRTRVSEDPDQWPFHHSIHAEGNTVLVAWRNNVATIAADGSITTRQLPPIDGFPIALLPNDGELTLFSATTTTLFATPVDGGETRVISEREFGAYEIASNGRTFYAVSYGGSIIRATSESGSSILSITLTTHVDPEIVRLGNGYLTLWGDHSSGADRLQFLVDDRITDIAQTTGVLGRHALASNGSEALVAWVHGNVIYAQRIAADGTLIDGPRQLATERVVRPAVVATNEGFVVLWMSGTKVESVLVTPHSTGPLQTQQLEIPQRAGFTTSFHDAHVAWNGRTLLVVAQGFESGTMYFPFYTPQKPRAIAFRLGIDSRPLDLPPGDSFSVAAEPHGDFMLVWDDADGTAAMRVNELLQPGEAMRVFHWTSNVRSDVAWNGRFVIAQRYGIDNEGWIAMRELDGSARGAYVDRDLAFRPDLAGDHIVVAEMTEDRIPRTYLYQSTELLPLVARPSAPVSARIIRFTDDTIEVAWTDTSSNERGFVVEQKQDNVWQLIATTQGTHVIAERLGAGPVRVRAWNEGGLSEAAEDVVPRRRSARH